MLNFIARFQFFFYPLLVHLSVTYQVPYITACILPLLFFIITRPFEGNKRSIFLKSRQLFLLILIAILSVYYLDHSIIYLPPILMMMAILYPFIRSIMPGKTALITRFYQLTKSENNPHKMSYTNKLTWVWIIFLLLLLSNNIILIFWAPLDTWSLFTNFINYLLLLALFILEWGFRLFWFKKWESPILFAKQLLTVDQRELFR